MSDASTAKTPWHLWAVGIVGLLWSGFGAYDYFMSNTRGEPYFREMGMTDAQIAYFNSYPAWMTAVWAIGVWGGVLGAVLLLLRSKRAFEVFVASLVAFVFSLIYAYGIHPMPGGEEASMMGIQAAIFIACVFFVWYARRARKSGLLR
jgi:hypothetical protein